MVGVCSGSKFPNCSLSSDGISPDPDIAGIGVILSFVIVNGLTVLITSISLLFISLEDLELRGVDLAIHRWVVKRGLKPLSSVMSEDTLKFWRGILEKILLGLSDTQLLTGIAILIAGYVKCDISVYHSTIVADLAWFASGTHLSSLQILKHYLRRYPATKLLRVALILTTAGLLLSLNVYQGNRDWYASLPYPAQCLFAEGVSRVGGVPAIWMGFNIFFVLLNCATVMLDLFRDSSDSTNKSQNRFTDQEPPASVSSVADSNRESAHEGNTKSNQDSLFFASRVWQAIVEGAKYLWYLVTDSYLVNSVIDIAWFAFGLYSILTDRATGELYMDEDDSSAQDEWGFGQIVPMLLVFLPMMNAWEIWYEAYYEAKLAKRRTESAEITLSLLSSQGPAGIFEPGREIQGDVGSQSSLQSPSPGRRPLSAAHLRSQSSELNDIVAVEDRISGDVQHDQITHMVSRVDSGSVAIDIDRLSHSTATVEDEPGQSFSRRSTFRSGDN